MTSPQWTCVGVVSGNDYDPNIKGLGIATNCTLVKNAKKIIVMQHGIPENTITYYSNILGLDPDDPSQVTKRKFNRPTVLQPLHSYNDKNDMLMKIFKDYLTNFNTDDNRSSQPFVIFCSRADYSLLLLYILRQIADENSGSTASDRVKGIWAQVQQEEWAAKFLSDPNTFAMECDILIVTSVLQAGHSLDRHFVTSYDFLFTDVLTFREELQFVSRLRYLGRQKYQARHCQFTERPPTYKCPLSVSSLRQLTSSFGHLSTYAAWRATLDGLDNDLLQPVTIFTIADVPNGQRYGVSDTSIAKASSSILQAVAIAVMMGRPGNQRQRLRDVLRERSQRRRVPRQEQ